MTDTEDRTADSTAALADIAPRLDALAHALNVKSVLVMRSDAQEMVVAATAGEAAKHYTVGAAGKKACGDQTRTPLYCERVVDSDAEVFVADSRHDPVFAGNEDEVEFGLLNYLGLAVHDAHGAVVGTVCVLDDTSRHYGEAERADLRRLRDAVESVVRTDPGALQTGT